MSAFFIGNEAQYICVNQECQKNCKKSKKGIQKNFYHVKEDKGLFVYKSESTLMRVCFFLWQKSTQKLHCIC
ncbi:hypothetical protein CHI05_04500 [Bacillus sp. 7788]|nr:hypothetical protein CHI05_04500 [Bacillus sp. 7788]